MLQHGLQSLGVILQETYGSLLRSYPGREAWVLHLDELEEQLLGLFAAPAESPGACHDAFASDDGDDARRVGAHSEDDAV